MLRKVLLLATALVALGGGSVLASAPAQALAPAHTTIAHRGGMTWPDATENSLGAYSRSFAAGATIEVDLRTTKDNYIVAMHDSTIDRTTRGTGSTRTKTLAQVRAAKLNDGSTVPTAYALMDLTRDNRSEAIIELKGSWNTTSYRRLATQLKNIGINKFIVQSKAWVHLNAIKKLVPSVRTAYVTWRPEDITTAQLNSVYGLIVAANHIDQHLIDRMRTHVLWAFFEYYDPENLESESEWARLTGTAGIITDNPEAYATWRS